MIRELGYLLLVFSFLTSFYGALTAFICSLTRQRTLLLSSRICSLYTALFALLTCVLLSYSFYFHDYSILYVYKNSSNDLPVFYRFSALWSSLEGSHLLWTTLLSFCTVCSLWFYHKNNESFLPIVSFCSQSILSWMFFLAVSSSNPFEPAFPVPSDGTGMNELLQNPYMIFHPPSLFLGYTALSIPFCYSLSSMWLGELSKDCLVTMRRWSLFSWIFLTLGVFLGGRWAYVELGWAGYWAWDPVENSSFMPWLFVTAFIHALILIKQSGKYKKLLFVLSFLSFFFCFFGTFITRSGIISSVHSFAQSDVATSYLVFLVILLAVFVVTYSLKGHKDFKSDMTKFPFFYNIDLLVLAQLLFASFAIIILMGTLYPIVSEYITGLRFSVQAPYFNSFAPYIGFSFIVLMTLGNLFKRKDYHSPFKLRVTLTLGSVAVVLSLLFCFNGRVFETTNWYGLMLQLIGVFLCFYSFVLFLYDFFIKYKVSKFTVGKFIKTHLNPFASLLTHLGVLIAVLGFLGNYRGVSKLVTLKRSESFSFYNYQFLFKGLELKQEENVLFYMAPLSLNKGKRELGLIYPARAKYPTKPELIHEIDYFSNFWHDIYVTLIDYDQEHGLWATLDFHINPTVRLVWLSSVFFIFGGILSLVSIRRPNN